MNMANVIQYLIVIKPQHCKTCLRHSLAETTGIRLKHLIVIVIFKPVFHHYKISRFLSSLFICYLNNKCPDPPLLPRFRDGINPGDIFFDRLPESVLFLEEDDCKSDSAAVFLRLFLTNASYIEMCPLDRYSSGYE